MHAPLFAGARVVVDLALGLIVFELGHRFDLDWLGRNRWLAVAAVGESFGALHGDLFRADVPGLHAAAGRLRGRRRHGDFAGGGDGGLAGAARLGPDHRAHAAVYRGQLRVRLRRADAVHAAGAPAE
ncbi:MAG: hypothetical protein WDO13_20440 [Verrucomicrobiota bacterium]